MPELAEVAYYAKQWDVGIGQHVTKVQLHPEARIFRQADNLAQWTDLLAGTRYEERWTHGKQMAFRFGKGWLWGHLGMTGKLWMAERDHVPEKHDHLVIHLTRHALVVTDPRMFGAWRWLSASAWASHEAGLAPPILSDAFTKALLNDFLKRRTRTPLKALLLQQERFPGIGNWMADEILWRSGLHPNRRADSLSPKEAGLLWQKCRLVARQALRVIGTDWSTPPNSWLFNHRWKDGGQCPCGTPLRRASVGGRTTCWCPRCQPATTEQMD